MKPTFLTPRASLFAAASIFGAMAPCDALAQAPSTELLACYGVCNRTVPNQQKRNACFQACRTGQAPATGGSATSAKPGAPTAKPAAAATTAPASGGNLTACYGVCNRTVQDQKKRSACFQACRTGQAPAGGGGGSTATTTATGSGAGAELDKELDSSRQVRGACIQACYQKNSNIDAQRRCEDVCYGQHQARSSAAYDRARAREGAAKAATSVPTGNCQAGCAALHARYTWEANQRGGAKFPAKATWVPACVLRCSPAMSACNEALAILRGAKNIKPGTAGYLGHARIELWEAKLGTCSAPDQYTLQTANEVRKAWKESLAAPRYFGE